MADDPSSTTIFHFNGNMETIMNIVSEMITEDDINKNLVREKLFLLSRNYIGLACENQTDRNCLDLSICAQEVLVAHRHIAYDFLSQKPITFANFNDYFDKLCQSLSDLYPSRIKKIVIENNPRLKKINEDYLEQLAC